jgi:hypothetical protein
MVELTSSIRVKMLKQLNQLPSPVVVFDMSAVGSTYSQSPSLYLANGEPVAGAPRLISESRDNEPQQGTEVEGGGATAGQERALVEAAAELHGLEAAEELGSDDEDLEEFAWPAGFGAPSESQALPAGTLFSDLTTPVLNGPEQSRAAHEYLPRPDYLSLFQSFPPSDTIGVWGVYSNPIVPPPNGNALHLLLESLGLGLGTSGATLEWQGKGHRKSSLLALLRFPHFIQAHSFLFRMCQLLAVDLACGAPHGRIHTRAGIAFAPYLSGEAHKERVAQTRRLEMLSVGAFDQLKLQEETLSSIQQQMADLQAQGDSLSSPFLEESLRLIQEMTDSIRTHVLPLKDCPPFPTRATTSNIHMTNASNAASLRVGSLNIRGKALSSLPKLIRMMGVVALNILGLQEVFKSGDIKIPGFTWYGLGGDCGSTKRMRGIGFLVKDSLKSLVTPCTQSLSALATGPEILWLKLLGTLTCATRMCQARTIHTMFARTISPL